MQHKNIKNTNEVNTVVGLFVILYKIPCIFLYRKNNVEKFQVTSLTFYKKDFLINNPDASIRGIVYF